MNIAKAPRKIRTNADSIRPRQTKFEAYFPYFEKYPNRKFEKTKRKSITRKARCESVHSTGTSCKRSTTPINLQKDNCKPDVCCKKSEFEEKPVVKRFVRGTQKSPKSFIIGRRKFQKNADSTFDVSIGNMANRPCSSLSRKREENSRDKVKDLGKYFEEFYEKSKILLQRFEQNMKKDKIV